MSLSEIIKKGLDLSALSLPDKQIESLLLFSEELKRWGSRMNITALINDDYAMVEELFIDSLAPTMLIKQAHDKEISLIDIGSGGGVPGIPLKIANPLLRVLLADGKSKKVFFLKHVIRSLSLEGIEAQKIRFDNKGHNPVEGRKFDWAVSKAVTDTGSLCLWAASLLKKGGRLIVMKGVKEGEGKCCNGYSEPETIKYSLPFSGAKRVLYVYIKL